MPGHIQLGRRSVPAGSASPNGFNTGRIGNFGSASGRQAREDRTFPPVELHVILMDSLTGRYGVAAQETVSQFRLSVIS
jgi:hypothetical protein